MILAAFAIALLAGMGVGSGGLFVVYLTLVSGFSQLGAQGLNLYFFIFASGAALLIHTRTQKLRAERLLYLCAFGSVGCTVGALIAQQTDTGVLRTVFGIVLIVSGVVSLFKKQPEKAQNAKSRR